MKKLINEYLYRHTLLIFLGLFFQACIEHVNNVPNAASLKKSEAAQVVSTGQEQRKPKPKPTVTPPVTATVTPTVTPTSIPTSTPTATPVPIPSPTPAPTPSPIPSPTPSPTAPMAQIIGSDGFLDPSIGDQWWRPSQYQNWTLHKYRNPHVKMLIALGGATYSDIWTSKLKAETLESIAQGMAKAVTTSYPVYEMRNSLYVQVGTVQIDGIDLDVEAGGRLPSAQATLVGNLIVRFKQLVPHKLITLTPLHTSADPVSCMTNTGSQCSYPYSSHSGEILPLFSVPNVTANIDRINLMAYDAGQNYPYLIALNNFAQYVPREKISLGLNIGTQWGSPEFVESTQSLINKAKEQDARGYGGIMIWAIGATGGNPVSQHISQMNSIIDNSRPLDHIVVYLTSWSTENVVMENLHPDVDAVNLAFAQLLLP